MNIPSVRMSRMGGCISLLALAAISACGGADNSSVDATHAFAFRGQMNFDNGRFGVDNGRFRIDPRSDAEIAQETRSMHIPVASAGGIDTIPAAQGSPVVPAPVAPAPAAPPAPASPTPPPAAPVPAPAPAPAPPVVTTASLAPWVDAKKIPLGSAGFATDKVTGTAELPAESGDGTGAFRTVCEFSHMAFDDPIVYPGQPGRSHLHVFFGNTGTNANSTAASLATTGNSTCRGGTINRSGYWVPAIIDTLDGTPVKPYSVVIYYKTGYNGIKPADVKPFPQGLRMIAGDSSNKAPYQWGGPGHFTCIDESGSGPQSQNIPVTCGVGNTIWASVMFPQCWDGVNLDSPDHKSHMSYPVDGKCPSTHPQAGPEIMINVLYGVTDAKALSRWRLASDNYDSSVPAGYSNHADWFNGWKPEFMDAFVKNCEQPPKNCQAHLLGNGQMMLGVGV